MNEHVKKTTEYSVIIIATLLVLSLTGCGLREGGHFRDRKAAVLGVKIDEIASSIEEEYSEDESDVEDIDEELSEEELSEEESYEDDSDEWSDEEELTQDDSDIDEELSEMDSEDDEVFDEESDDEEPEKVIKVPFNSERALEYCEQPICEYNPESCTIDYNVTFLKGVPESDDDNIYLFGFATYESESDFAGRRPAATGAKSRRVKLSMEYQERRLFERYVPALLVNGEYVALSEGQYITNPEALAQNRDEYPEVASKKGLLLDPNTIDKDELYNLNVKRLVFNIPLSYVLGESDNPDCPTINCEYEGRVYHFDAYKLAGFDSVFSYLTENGFHTTAIILNDWNNDYPAIMHPKSRTRTGKSLYYAFNTEEEEGVRLMEATALFLAKRYSGGEYGMVHDWVIANEINQQKIWNYMATSDVEYYTDSFEKSFRTFYNAIRSYYANAHVYYSIDHDWNDNGGNNAAFFNGREIVCKFNELACMRGNYDWGLSIHPYPNPLTKVRFWKGDYDHTENAKVITPMNLSSLTEVMTKDEMLNTKGEVRDIAVTELGFSSGAGEKVQAAAFAYCYYIIDDNEYIDSFLLNRQTDDAASLGSGLALGIYNNDYSPKYIAKVFRNIDSKKGEAYIPEMLGIIGEDSLEEALERAR